MNIKKLIQRNIAAEPVSVRSADDGNKYIEGYAIVFNQQSKLIRDWAGEYVEIIDPGAVDDVLTDPDLNVIATINHDRFEMLGRTASGTLELIKDDKGLKYRIKIPDTTLGRDTVEMINRGDFFESSFIFTASAESWDKEPTPPVRTILKIEDIYDVSIVVDGAYANTDVALRQWIRHCDEAGRKSDILIKRKQLEIYNFLKNE